MEITENRTADIVTLSLSGKLDGSTAKAFEEKILGQIESGDRRFIIDLGQLDYVSSAGLRVFAVASKRLNGVNGKIVLCGFQKNSSLPHSESSHGSGQRSVRHSRVFVSFFDLRFPGRSHQRSPGVNSVCTQGRGHHPGSVNKSRNAWKFSYPVVTEP